MSQMTFKPTPAFQKKELQLRKEIVVRTNKRLRNDLNQLLHDHQFCNLILEAKPMQLALHSFIIEARCPEFYQFIQGQPDPRRVSVPHNELTQPELESWVNTLYSSDTIDLDYIRKTFHLDTTGAVKGTALRRTNTSLSRDLLSLLTESSTTDVEFGITGKGIRAHRAILATRCDYFRAMFSSSWREGTQARIEIPDVSHEMFVAVLRFIYAGDQEILRFSASKCLRFADMYGMQDLAELVVSDMKITKCHLFHKPCATCVPLACECLANCEHYVQTENFQRECIRWLGRYHRKTLACKRLHLLLSDSLMNRLREEILKMLREKTPAASVVDWLGFKMAKTSMETVNAPWTRAAARFVDEIRDECGKMILENFHDVCELSNVFAVLKELDHSSSQLETFLDEILERMTVGNCCDIHRGLQHMVDLGAVCNPFDSDCFQVVVESLNRCEKFIIGRIGPVSRTKSWGQKLSATKQQELKNSAFFVDL